jgi:hypothetical protein
VADIGTVSLPFIDFNRPPTFFPTIFFNTVSETFFFETVLRQRSIDILNRRQILDIGGWPECVPGGRKVPLSLEKSASLIN